MKSGIDSILIEIDRSKEAVAYSTPLGDITIDTRLRPLWYINQVGTIVGLPHHLSDKSFNLYLGQTVIVNHGWIREENLIEDKYYHVPLELVLGLVEDGKLIPVNGRVFLDKQEVLDEDTIYSGLKIPVFNKIKPAVGVVKAVAPNKYGIENNHLAYFHPKFEYDILFNGERLYCFHEFTLLGYLEDGIKAYGDNVIVRPISVSREYHGLDLPDSVKSIKANSGVVVSKGTLVSKTIFEGQTVYFQPMDYTSYKGDYIMSEEMLHFDEKLKIA